MQFSVELRVHIWQLNQTLAHYFVVFFMREDFLFSIFIIKKAEPEETEESQ